MELQRRAHFNHLFISLKLIKPDLSSGPGSSQPPCNEVAAGCGIAKTLERGGERDVYFMDPF